MVDDVRERLREERERAQERLAHLRADREEIVATVQLDPPDDEHDPDGATLAWEREQLAALIAAQTERIAAIDQALARIEEGTHGVCERCGDPIPAARLEVRPAATHCVGCAD